MHSETLSFQPDSNIPMPLAPGARVGVYEILSPLGAGGMGEVYRARDVRLHRDVALKVLPREFQADPDRLRRLTNEARAASALNHPNILTVYDVNVSDIGPFIVMELVEGQTLRTRLQAGPIPVLEAVDIAIQIGLALAAAHAQGLVHRDLKPENVMVRPDGYVKVLDFGLATLQPDPVRSGVPMSAFETVEAVHGGTPPYMAPEQIEGWPVGERADVFALGIVLCELITGVNPFARPSVLETLAAIGQSPRSVDSSRLPRDIRDIVTRALACRPDDRYPSMAAFVEALRAHKRTVEVRAAARASRMAVSVAASMVATVVVTATVWWLRLSPRTAPQPVQLTHFSTAVRDPAVSPDGHWIAYVVQEADTPYSQVYVQAGLAGEPHQLTRTPDQKRYPAFARDGSRIAYTVTGSEWQWDTWVVGLAGGEPHPLLPNASALQWVDDRHVIFSEFKKGMQLGVVWADESRAGARDLYVPPFDAMAHHADISPDGRRVVIGEMRAALHNTASIPLDCFIMRLDQPAAPRVEVGSADVPCAMFARWSRNGRWIYFSSGRANQYQAFRQSPAGGRPEQITSGTGLAVLGVTSSFVLTPDDRTLIYPSGEGQEAIWLRRPDGTATQLTLEGNARDPTASRDGHKIFYVAGPRYAEGQLWMRSVDGVTSRQICPGFTATSIGASPEGNRVAFTTKDAHQHLQLWLAAVDNASPPRELTTGQDDWLTPTFDPDGRTVYVLDRRGDGESRVVGVSIETGQQRPVTSWERGLELRSVSPDGQWISIVRGAVTPREAWIYPTQLNGRARKLWNTWAFAWAANGGGFLLTSGGMVSRAWLLANPNGALVPPDLGDDPTEASLERVGGRHVMTEYFFVEPNPLPNADGIVYGKVENHSNLYALTLPK